MKSFAQLGPLLGAVLSLISPTLAAPFNETWDIETRAAAGERLVFAHFMVGIVAPRNSRADWDSDMIRARDAGIDAFALNIAGQRTDDYTLKQLDLAYESAAANNMKLFISFDFNYFSPVRDAHAEVAGLINTYGRKDAALKIGNKPFVSSFVGDGGNSGGPLNVAAMKNLLEREIYFAPNFAPWNTANPGLLDAAFNWMGWVSDGLNGPPRQGATKTVEDGDREYKTWLGSKQYMAPVSPWFSTHYIFGDYIKNWVMGGGMGWFDRWNIILQTSPDYLEIVSWNDYGESHYIGPLSSIHGDDGNSKWVNDMPHDGWLEMAKPFIAAYKARASKPDAYITKDQIIYWYRPTPKAVNCDSTDPNGPRPNGWDTYEDAVYVVSLLTQGGKITVNSGGNSRSWDAPAGAYAQKVNMGVGAQRFDLSRNGNSVISGTSPKEISNTCPCGINNWNAFVGQIPFQPFGVLGGAAFGKFSDGLRVTTCQPVPTLNGNYGGVTPPTTSTTPPSPDPTGTTCNGGINRSDVTGNLSGLCSFACARNYCPPDACICTSRGTPLSPTWNTPKGCPLPGEGDIYKGLCDYACSNDYCPPTACTRNNCN